MSRSGATARGSPADPTAAVMDATSTAGISSGGGGGASDVRTTSCGGTCPGQAASLATRLLVAAGGGGGSVGYVPFNGAGGAGGAAGNSQQPGGWIGPRVRATLAATEKVAGRVSSSQGGSGGAAGTGEHPAGAGTDGNSGQGGSGPDRRRRLHAEPGGGGGGGYYGGGGGGGVRIQWRRSAPVVAGGGGAGSRPRIQVGATNPSIGADATGVPDWSRSRYAPATSGELLSALADKVADRRASHRRCRSSSSRSRVTSTTTTTKKACKSFNGFASRVKGMVKVKKLSSSGPNSTPPSHRSGAEREAPMTTPPTVAADGSGGPRPCAPGTSRRRA